MDKKLKLNVEWFRGVNQLNNLNPIDELDNIIKNETSLKRFNESFNRAMIDMHKIKNEMEKYMTELMVTKNIKICESCGRILEDDGKFFCEDCDKKLSNHILYLKTKLDELEKLLKKETREELIEMIKNGNDSDSIKKVEKNRKRVNIKVSNEKDTNITNMCIYDDDYTGIWYSKKEDHNKKFKHLDYNTFVSMENPYEEFIFYTDDTVENIVTPLLVEDMFDEWVFLNENLFVINVNTKYNLIKPYRKHISKMTLNNDNSIDLDLVDMSISETNDNGITEDIIGVEHSKLNISLLNTYHNVESYSPASIYNHILHPLSITISNGGKEITIGESEKYYTKRLIERIESRANEDLKFVLKQIGVKK